MDSASPTNPLENTNEKPSFHKRTQDAANRKYRRHSPGGSDSSSSGGSSKHRNRSPPQPEIRNRRDDKKDSVRYYDKHMHDTSHGYAKNDNSSRHHSRRHADDEDRDYHRSSRAISDKYPRDKYSRDNKDYNHNVRDAGRGRVAREELRDHRRSSDYINDRKYSREDKKVNGKDSTYGRTYGHKESEERKEKINREAETEANMKEPQEQSALKKLKSYDSEDEKPSMSLKGVEGKSVKVTAEPSVNQSETTGDVNVAKVASMKAAELVNKNLAGSSYMSTDQKKKLLWGNKKNTSTVEKQSGALWNQQLFEDRERQEKFNKLMNLRLPWYHWPIVGCKRQCKYRVQSNNNECRNETKAGDGFGEAIHSWSSQKRWSDCWPWSLNVIVIITVLLLFLSTITCCKYLSCKQNMMVCETV